MTRALSSEWLKLRTTKTSGAFALTGVGLAVLVAILIATTDDPASLGRSLDTFPGFTKLAGFVGLLTFAAGIRVFTDEYRFATITGTALGTPRRAVVLAAKAMSSAGLGGLIGLLALGGVGVVAVIRLALLDGPIAAGPDFTRILIGSVVAMALWAAFGVGLAATVPRDTLMIVVGVVWILAGENILSALVPSVAMYLPAHAAAAMSEAAQEGLLSPIVGAAVFTGYVAVALASGFAAFVRRDVP